MENDLISRSALWTDIMMLPHNGDIISSEEVEQTIVEAPAVDAVPVVRCKDCVERTETGRCNCITGRNIYVQVGDAFFCSYGERRADDAD